MLSSMCPICLADAGVQVLRANDNSEIIVYSCQKHGVFSLTHELNSQLLQFHARDAVQKLADFEKKVLRHTQGVSGSQSYAPLFRSFDE